MPLTKVPTKFPKPSSTTDDASPSDANCLTSETIGELLLTRIELGPGHLGRCEKCRKVFVKERGTARFCSPACREKNRSPRGDYIKTKMKGYRKETSSQPLDGAGVRRPDEESGR